MGILSLKRSAQRAQMVGTGCEEEETLLVGSGFGRRLFSHPQHFSVGMAGFFGLCERFLGRVWMQLALTVTDK
jgi:hypothetical protein